MWYVADNDYLMHYGVKGMVKGRRRWTNPDGTLTEAGKARYGKKVGTGPRKKPDWHGKINSNSGMLTLNTVDSGSTGHTVAANLYTGDQWVDGKYDGRYSTALPSGSTSGDLVDNFREAKRRKRQRGKRGAQYNKDRFFKNKNSASSSATSNRPVHREKHITTSGGAYKRPIN